MGLQMEEFTISDLAQAVVLGLGALGSLLLVVWQSRCLCRCRIGLGDRCYLFDCERAPPPVVDEDEDDDKDKKDKDKKDKGKPDKPVVNDIESNTETEEEVVPLSPSSVRSSRSNNP